MAESKVGIDYVIEFVVRNGNGTPRTGITVTNFTPRVRALDTAVDDGAVANVVEIGDGRYSFIIRGAFTTAQGAGNYGWSIQIADPPVNDIASDTIRFLVNDEDDIIADTDDIQTRIPAVLVGGRMDSDVGNMQANTLTAAALATDAVNEIAAATEALILATPGQPIATDAAGRVSANVVQWLGATVNALVAGRVPSDVQTWLGSAVNALIAGRVDVSVGNMQANVITAASIAAAAITAAKFATGAIDANAIAADAATEIADAVDVVLTGAHGAGAWTSASSTDWSTAEREQIRSRLGIDGTRTLPTFVGSSLVDLVFSLADTIFLGHNLARAIRNIYSTSALATTGGPSVQSFKEPDGTTEQHRTTTSGSGDRVVNVLGA